MLSDKAINPEWEQRPNWDIMRALAARFGCEKAFTEGLTLKVGTQTLRRNEKESSGYAQLEWFP